MILGYCTPYREPCEFTTIADNGRGVSVESSRALDTPSAPEILPYLSWHILHTDIAPIGVRELIQKY
jgi:hypothetical protein